MEMIEKPPLNVSSSWITLVFLRPDLRVKTQKINLNFGSQVSSNLWRRTWDQQPLRLSFVLHNFTKLNEHFCCENSSLTKTADTFWNEHFQ